MISTLGADVLFNSASDKFEPMVVLEAASNGFARFDSFFETRAKVSIFANLEKAWSAKDELGAELGVALKGFDWSSLNEFIEKRGGSAAEIGCTATSVSASVYPF